MREGESEEGGDLQGQSQGQRGRLTFARSASDTVNFENLHAHSFVKLDILPYRMCDEAMMAVLIGRGVAENVVPHAGW